MTLLLAHHDAIQALPAFAPAIVVCGLLLVRYLRGRRDGDAAERAPGGATQDDRRARGD